MAKVLSSLLSIGLPLALACASGGAGPAPAPGPGPGERIPAFEDYAKTPGADYLEFLAVGDAGTGTADQYAVGAAMAAYARASPVAFVLYLGDNFYGGGVHSVTDPLWSTRFEDVYAPDALDVPFYAILGNHDYEGDVQAELDYASPNADRWRMPARYHAIRQALPDGTQVDLFFLDTVAFDEPQRQWLAAGLAASPARWKLVMGHHPVFSNGLHGDSADLIARLEPALEAGADLYLAGHEHDLQILEPVNGVSHVIDGAGGQRRDSGVGANTVFAVGRLGFMDFLVSRRDLVCRVFDSSGRLVYSRVLTHRPP